MNGFHPDRYYKILIKTKILSTNEGPLSAFTTEAQMYSALQGYSDNQIADLPYEYITIDDDIIFKITR